jgi:3D (Asp-Asp-Asp) domain-containing protein
MSASDPRFEFPAPSQLPDDRKLKLWATNYHAYPAQAQQTGEPLRDMQGRDLGVLLTPSDWCRGGIEGTFCVTGLDGKPVVFNFAGSGDHQQVDCGAVLHSHNPAVTGAGRNRYQMAKGPYGDGVKSFFLVPYRTIAVDKTENPIPYGTVIYIPPARGQQLALPSGKQVVHDGYFFAADTGGAIKGPHIDVFTGIEDHSPFSFIKSVSTGIFEAFVIDDPGIKTQLRQDHITR